MPSSAFRSALPFVLRWEGGFVDHPNDPGGRTNKGITQKTYDAWRARHGLLQRDVREIGDQEAHAIYASDYWLPPRCDLLFEPLTLAQFDTAVNMGPVRAVRFLQAAVDAEVDGDFGPVTLAAVQRSDSGRALIRYCDARETFYRGLAANKPELQVFLKGWLNRLNALRSEIGLPGFEAVQRRAVDFGDASYIRKIPDVGADADFDLF